MVQKQWRRWSDLSSRDADKCEQHGDFGVHGHCLFRERKRTCVLWHARVDEQHRSHPDAEESEETAGQSECVLWRLGRAMQLAPCQQAVDDMSLLMEPHHTFVHKVGQKTERIAWNFDKLAAALQTEKGRVEFLEDLQNTLQRKHLTITGHPALRHFSRDKRTKCEVTKRASLERIENLAERRRLRMTAGARRRGAKADIHRAFVSTSQGCEEQNIRAHQCKCSVTVCFQGVAGITSGERSHECHLSGLHCDGKRASGDLR